MANPKRGQVKAKFAGKSINLKLTFNGLCELEDLYGQDISTITVQFSKDAATGKTSLKDMRAIIWASMLDEMPDASLADAGVIAADLGQEKLGETVNAVLEGSGLFGDGKKEVKPTSGKPKAKAR